jgi:hypothetical protein
MLQNSLTSTDVHSSCKTTLFAVLYNEFDNSTGRFHTFLNFGKYHEFSFLLNDRTMPPQGRRA